MGARCFSCIDVARLLCTACPQTKTRKKTKLARKTKRRKTTAVDKKTSSSASAVVIRRPPAPGNGAAAPAPRPEMLGHRVEGSTSPWGPAGVGHGGVAGMLCQLNGFDFSSSANLSGLGGGGTAGGGAAFPTVAFKFKMAAQSKANVPALQAALLPDASSGSTPAAQITIK